MCMNITLKGKVVTLMLLIIGWMKITPFFECVGDSGNRRYHGGIRFILG